MTLTAPATRKIRGFKAGFTIQPTTPAAPAAPVIGTILVLDNYILTVPISSVPEDADYAQLLWSDTENGTYTIYQDNIPALVTTDVQVNTVTALTKWFKAKSLNDYGSSLSAAVSATSSAGSSATPNQMVNLRVTSKTTTSLTYTWDALANVTSYTLQRWNAGAGNWTTDQVTGITDTTYTINTLTANTEYGVRGRGVNTNAAQPLGAFSAETWDFTESNTLPVPVPPVVTWQRISSTVIRFLFAGGSDATSWNGFSRSPSGSGSFVGPISLTVDQASYDLTVAINESADFYVTATNDDGSENSNIATATGQQSGTGTLTGTGFGTNADFAPMKFMDFTGLSNGDTWVQAGGTAIDYSSNTGLHYTATAYVDNGDGLPSGGGCFEKKILGDNANASGVDGPFNRERIDFTASDAVTVWKHVKQIYVSGSVGPSIHQYKHTRIGTNPSNPYALSPRTHAEHQSGSTSGVDANAFLPRINNEAAVPIDGPRGNFPAWGQWNSFFTQAAMNSANGVADGTYREWAAGTYTVNRFGTVDIRDTAGLQWRCVLPNPGLANSYGAGGTWTVRHARIVVTRGLAWCAFGNASTFAACTDLLVVEPADTATESGWSDTKINFNPHGTIPGTHQWMYVMKTDGNLVSSNGSTSWSIA